MTNEELKKKLFELMFALDDKSAGKDYVALRNQHYSNMRWLYDNNLQGEYYDYFFEQIAPRIKADNEKHNRTVLKEMQKNGVQE